MNEQQMDRLIGRLDMTATPNPEWVSKSLTNVLPAVREARRYDASRLGQAAFTLASLRRLLRTGGSRKTYLSIAIALLLTGTVVAFLVGGATRPPPGGPGGLLILANDAGLQSIDIRDGSTTVLLPPDIHVKAISRSTDGRLLAYRRHADDGDHYEIMSTDGTERRPVAAGFVIEGDSCNDVWSPDSRSFVTSVDVVSEAKGRVLVINAGTGEGKFVTPESVEAHCPIWSPAGDWIAYTTDEGLWKVRPDGSDPTLISEDAGNPTSWSGAGWIYRDNDGVVTRTNVDTGETDPLGDYRFGVPHAPALSPDGSHLAILYSLNDRPSFDLYLADPDGEKQERLLRDVVDWGGWSANGRYLLAALAPEADSNQMAGLLAVTPGGAVSLVAPFTEACPPSLESTCFKDLGWGQSRP